MSGGSNGNGVWKWIASALAGLVAGLATAVWAAGDKPDRREVKEIVRDNAPYLLEAGVIKKGITDNAETIASNKDSIDTLDGKLDSLREQLYRDTQSILRAIEQSRSEQSQR